MCDVCVPMDFWIFPGELMCNCSEGKETKVSATEVSGADNNLF